MIKMNMPDGIQNRDARFKILVQGPGLLSYEIPPKSISNSRIHLTRLLYTPGNSNVKIIVSDKWKNELFASYVTLFFSVLQVKEAVVSYCE